MGYIIVCNVQDLCSLHTSQATHTGETWDGKGLIAGQYRYVLYVCTSTYILSKKWVIKMHRKKYNSGNLAYPSYSSYYHRSLMTTHGQDRKHREISNSAPVSTKVTEPILHNTLTQYVLYVCTYLVER